MDTVWPLGFVVIAAVSFGLSAGSGHAGRRALVLLLVAVWGLRLGTHIHRRNAGQGEDKRYASLLRRNRGSLAAFVLRYIYWAQGRVMWFVSLPVQVAMYEHAPVGAVTWLGAAVWALGFGFEAVGDAQLRRFRADPANAGRVLDRGLWRYTRHPKARPTPIMSATPAVSSPGRRGERAAVLSGRTLLTDEAASFGLILSYRLT